MLGKERPGGRRVSREKWQNGECERLWPQGEVLLTGRGLEWRLFGTKLMCRREVDGYTGITNLGRFSVGLMEDLGVTQSGRS